ncbi:flagellar motor protein [Acidocella sp.]|uniref:flagellar motor protein n=1 Tax=Acidocella sp. TaxID=50710 RepID=UPI002639EBFD|nr:flagellar motor protein [Acidocella sp.]
MSSLIGLVLGFLVVIGGALSDHDPLSSLCSLTAVIIVICGSFTATMVHFGFQSVLGAFKAIIWLVKPPKVDLTEFVSNLSDWSSLARSQGTLALEKVVDEVDEPLQKRGLQLIIDNNSLDDLETILFECSDLSGKKQVEAGEVWEAIGGYSPTIGVMGAVLGLIHVMMRLNHPEELGGGIATAFVATIYGVGFANLIALPLGARLKHLAKELGHERSILVKGLVLLAEGKPGVVIRQSLDAFITKSKDKNKVENTEERTAEAGE